MPTKEQIRKHMQDRLKSKLPPPSPEETRRKLGWFLKKEKKS